MNAPKEPHSFPFSAQRRFRIPVRSDGYLIITRAKAKDKQFFVFLANKSAPTSFLAPSDTFSTHSIFLFPRLFNNVFFIYSPAVCPQFRTKFCFFAILYTVFFNNAYKLWTTLWIPVDNSALSTDFYSADMPSDVQKTESEKVIHIFSTIIHNYPTNQQFSAFFYNICAANQYFLSTILRTSVHNPPPIRNKRILRRVACIFPSARKSASVLRTRTSKEAKALNGLQNGKKAPCEPPSTKKRKTRYGLPNDEKARRRKIAAPRRTLILFFHRYEQTGAR